MACRGRDCSAGFATIGGRTYSVGMEEGDSLFLRSGGYLDQQRDMGDYIRSSIVSSADGTVNITVDDGRASTVDFDDLTISNAVDGPNWIWSVDEGVLYISKGEKDYTCTISATLTANGTSFSDYLVETLSCADNSQRS